MKLKMEIVKVTLEGIADIMFDRFYDHSDEKRPAEQKLYLYGNNEVVLPATNFYAFLNGSKKPGLLKTIHGRKAGKYLAVSPGHVFVEEDPIFFLDENENTIQFKAEDLYSKNSSKFLIWEESALGGSGNKLVKLEINPRPVMKTPWFLKFTLQIIENELINASKLEHWMAIGGIRVALCNYRPRFGRFFIKDWEVSEQG
jgi:hypothetical protein